MLGKLDGYKTYIIGAAIILGEVCKYLLGEGSIDIEKVLMGLAILTGRQAIGKVETLMLSKKDKW